MNKHQHDLEHGLNLNLDFNKLENVALLKLIPVVVQNIENNEVLILAYTNKEAIETSLKTKIATFWSASRNELWIKGATSGEYLELIEMKVNCEQNSLLYLVKIMNKGACHVKDKNNIPYKSCYYRKIIDIHSLEII